MSRLVAVAEMGLAGALTGFMIGPDSLRQFVGVDYANSFAMNVIVGAAVGTLLGFLATLSTTQAE